MADETANGSDPFDVQTIKQLVALMSRHDLSEIDLHRGTNRIRLRRGAMAPVVPAAAPAPAALPPAASAVPAAAPAKEGQSGKQLHLIKSPTPGTFYNREKPEAAAYVTAGTRVAPNTVVGLIEAMKIFNEIYAECSGVIVETLVENAQPVEYGTILFKVDPAG